jgi:hypothetical protein
MICGTTEFKNSAARLTNLLSTKYDLNTLKTIVLTPTQQEEILLAILNYTDIKQLSRDLEILEALSKRDVKRQFNQITNVLQKKINDIQVKKAHDSQTLKLSNGIGLQTLARCLGERKYQALKPRLETQQELVDKNRLITLQMIQNDSQSKDRFELLEDGSYLYRLNEKAFIESVGYRQLNANDEVIYYGSQVATSIKGIKKESETYANAKKFAATLNKSKQFHRIHDSYGLKHIGEAFIKYNKRLDEDYYMSNGEYIIAMLESGFNMEVIADDTPNLIFKIDKKSLFDEKNIQLQRKMMWKHETQLKEMVASLLRDEEVEFVFTIDNHGSNVGIKAQKLTKISNMELSHAHMIDAYRFVLDVEVDLYFDIETDEYEDNEIGGGFINDKRFRYDERFNFTIEVHQQDIAKHYFMSEKSVDVQLAYIDIYDAVALPNSTQNPSYSSSKKDIQDYYGVLDLPNNRYKAYKCKSSYVSTYE